MSVEILRRAAVLMRERATDAAEAWGEGPWRHDDLGYNDAHGMTYDVKDAQGAHVASAGCEELAHHIASWHLAAALAVADWLDSVAWALTPPGNGPLSGRSIGAADEMHAITVARAYLGEAS